MFDTSTFTSIQNNAGLPAWNALMKPSDLIALLLPYLFGAGGIILLIMLISAGYQMMFSKGDPKAMQAAQAKMTTSAIGIVLLFAAFWIVRIVGQFLGIGVFENVFK